MAPRQFWHIQGRNLSQLLKELSEAEEAQVEEFSSSIKIEKILQDREGDWVLVLSAIVP